jgi:TfoX N-terminal domain
VPYDPILAERVRHLLADRADFHEKRLMGGIAFMVKGGMCCAASGRGGLLVRIQPETQPALLAPPQVVPMTMAGRKVKSFIRVMPDGYRTPASLKKWVDRGLAAVAEIKAKPKSGRR